MNVLVVGSGGREHALVWKLAQSPSIQTLYCAPGNAGCQQLAESVAISETDIDGLCQFAQERHIDLTVVSLKCLWLWGSRMSLPKHGCASLAPPGARTEASKTFAKPLCKLWHSDCSGKSLTISRRLRPIFAT